MADATSHVSNLDLTYQLNQAAVSLISLASGFALLTRAAACLDKPWIDLPIVAAGRMVAPAFTTRSGAY